MPVKSGLLLLLAMDHLVVSEIVDRLTVIACCLLLVNVNLMVKKFQDFISVISNQNVSQGHINFPMKLKIAIG